MEWIDLKTELPDPKGLYFITDGKDVALARFKIDGMRWNFLWHYSCFNPTHAARVILPSFPNQESSDATI